MVPPDFLFDLSYLAAYGFPQKRQIIQKGTREAAISFATTADGADTDG
jgi:hypothetical protein